MRSIRNAWKAVLHQNQFGGTAGGPILHDKLFFFSDYQGTRMVNGLDSGVISTPSAQDQTGNLSDVASLLTGTVNGATWANSLTQTLGYPVTSGEAYYTPGCTTSAQCVLPDAVIPQSAFSAPAKADAKFIPTPNTAGGFSTCAPRGSVGLALMVSARVPAPKSAPIPSSRQRGPTRRCGEGPGYP